MFLDGYGMFAIAEALTRDEIPCPSAQDPARNRHRTGTAWSKGAVRVILTNPRYTGRQVWNKQRTDEVLLDVDDVALGHTAIMRWNRPEQWISSKELAHEPLIDQATFDRAQEILNRRARTGTSPRRTYPSRHPYVFKSLVFCGVCHRRMQGQHSHGVAYYRCRYPQEYAMANNIDHPRNVILREDTLIGPLDTWLAQEFSPLQRRHTIAKLVQQAAAGAPGLPQSPDMPTVAQCDAKLARYRAALEAGADPAVVTAWITETQTERQRAQERERAKTHQAANPASTTLLTEEEVMAIIEQLGDMITVLREAEPEQKLEVYRNLRLALTYSPETQTVRAEIDLAQHRWPSVGVRGWTHSDGQPRIHLAGTVFLS